MTQPNPTTEPHAVPQSAPQSAPAQAAMPLLIERAVMEAALRTGQATILSPLVTGLARYQDQWWIDTTDVWAQITDTAFAATLEARHTRGTWR